MELKFGSEDGLAFRLLWATASPSGSAAEATRGTIALSIEGVEQWRGHSPGIGFAWTWIELLEFLSSAWPYLELEDGFPLGLRPNRPNHVLVDVENQWLDLPAGARERQESVIESFQETHDLARALHGAVLPSIWIVREGTRCWICSAERAIRRHHSEVVAALSKLADEIAKRISTLSDERAIQARMAWSKRAALQLQDQVRIATGLPDNTIGIIQHAESAKQTWELSGNRLETNELLVAARMAAALDPVSIRRIIQQIKKAGSFGTDKLDAISRQCVQVIETASDHEPFEQGYVLAAHVRETLGVASKNGRVDPLELLNRWGVKVVEANLDAQPLDAIACWSDRHGPIVCMNTSGLHNTSEEGRRATLAHEICHVLIDRGQALPFVEVLGGRVSPLVEKRARAFAAELLFPRSEATKFTGSDAPERVVDSLRKRFGVSRELIAWQVHNSGVELRPKVRSYLSRYVSNSSAFDG